MTETPQNTDNSTGRQLRIDDFLEPMFVPGGIVPCGSILRISDRWQVIGAAYITLYDDATGSHADFIVKRIFRHGEQACLLLALPPTQAGEFDVPPLYMVRMRGADEVVLLEEKEMAAVLPLPALGHREKCNLEMLAASLGGLDTWEEVLKRIE